MSAAKKRPRNAADARAADLDVEALLRAHPSPFSDAVLANASCDTPDVPQIHADVRARCLALIREARESGRSRLQVITGDPGGGKTHLLAWMRRTSEDGWRHPEPHGRMCIAIVPPLRVLDRARHHVLQEVVRQLSVRLPGEIHVDDATDTPIEIVLWRALLAICSLVVRARRTSAALRERLDAVLATNAEKYLSACVHDLREVWRLVGDDVTHAALGLPELADVDREVFRVLLRFPNGEEPHRAAILDWLGGGSLGAERLARLDTSLVLDDESGAERALRTLLVMARLARIPLVIGFDQIEGTARLGNEAVAAFLGTITELWNDTKGAVLLVFCQTHLWPALRDSAEKGVRDRLEDTPPFHLKSLTHDEALLLVEARMRHFYDGHGVALSDPFVPLGRDLVRAEIVALRERTPRALVRHFQALLREAPEQRASFGGAPAAAPADVVRRKLDALIAEEARAARPPDGRSAIVHAMTRAVLEHARDAKGKGRACEVIDVAPHRVGKATLTGLVATLGRAGARRRVYLEATNSQHGKSAASTARRLSDAVSSAGADVAVLLREASLPLPPAAQKIIADAGTGIVIVRLEEGEVAPLAAVEALLNAAASGDIPVDRKTALDVAMEHVAQAGAIVDRIAAAAFTETDRAAAPSSALAERVRARLLETLIEPTAHVAEALRTTVEEVDAAASQLAATGVLEIALDRQRAQVILLRPEAWS